MKIKGILKQAIFNQCERFQSPPSTSILQPVLMLVELTPYDFIGVDIHC